MDTEQIERLRALSREWIEESVVAHKAGRADIRDVLTACALELAEVLGERDHYTDELEGP